MRGHELPAYWFGLSVKVTLPIRALKQPAYFNNPRGGVAQLVRARGSYPRRRQFDSAHRHHFVFSTLLLIRASRVAEGKFPG